MELRHLRYFVAVAHHLNYSEASRSLHVAQPAISQTILDLEEELGIKLLHRTKRTVQLTTAGAVFLGEAEQSCVMRLKQRRWRGAPRVWGGRKLGHRLLRRRLEPVLAFSRAVVSAEIS